MELNAQNADGRTLLHLAAIVGNTRVVKYLLSDPTVDANIRDNYGWTPLIGAMSHGCEAACDALIESDKVTLMSGLTLHICLSLEHLCKKAPWAVSKTL